MDEHDNIHEENNETRDNYFNSMKTELDGMEQQQAQQAQESVANAQTEAKAVAEAVANAVAEAVAKSDVKPADGITAPPPFVPNHASQALPPQVFQQQPAANPYTQQPNYNRGYNAPAYNPYASPMPQQFQPQQFNPQPQQFNPQMNYRQPMPQQFSQPFYPQQPQFYQQPQQYYQQPQYFQPQPQPMPQQFFQQPQNPYVQNVPQMPKYTLKEDDMPSATIAAEKKPVSNAKFAVVLSSIIAGVVLITIAVGLVVAKMSENGDFGAIPKKEVVEINLPIAERPQLEAEDYQADGRYTTEGVAKALYPSIFRVDVYRDDHTTVSASGSAIVLTADGYLVTNAHVIEDTKKVEVIDFENNVYTAQIVGSDEKTDVAVLKINKDGLTPAQFGDSDGVILGEQVMSIGNTLDQVTTSFGWVTSIERDLRANGNGYMVSNIQTDAACNPGNSGGALVNMYGQVIGMITSGMDTSYFSMISFAMTSNEIKPVIEALIEDGYVSDRPRVGITYTGITDELAEKLDIEAGMYVQEIDESCDVANCGLEVYDVITEVNGHKIRTSADTLDAIDGMKPGDECTIHVMRYSRTRGVEEFDFTFKLEEALKPGE